MQGNQLIEAFSQTKTFHLASQALHKNQNIYASNLVASARGFFAASFYQTTERHQVYILNTKDEAAFFYNDLVALMGQEHVYFLPHLTNYDFQQHPNQSENQQRSEALNILSSTVNAKILVTYPQSIQSKFPEDRSIDEQSKTLEVNGVYNIDDLIDWLVAQDFTHEDFVFSPGQFSLRGGILDIYSFAYKYPFRIELFDQQIESIRSFNPEDQLSVKTYQKAKFLPDLQKIKLDKYSVNFFEKLSDAPLVFVQDFSFVTQRIDHLYEQAQKKHDSELKVDYFLASAQQITDQLLNYTLCIFEQNDALAFEVFEHDFDTKPQLVFKKQFDLLGNTLKENTANGIQNLVFSHNPKQIERLYSILEDLKVEPFFKPCYFALSGGFMSPSSKISCFTDHEIFERFHRYKLDEIHKKSIRAKSLKDLIALQKGDYVVHVNHGIGVFDGLQIVESAGQKQEAIRLIYRDNDLLYVNIHSLHKISKYASKEGKTPKLEKLGTKNWAIKKAKTKARVKTLAFDLIKLYAKRKAQKGFAFAPDNYLQRELEASFMFEDTEDQFKATQAIKEDMQGGYPMDRLVCGDVGFGKTEVAIRAAFKAVCDSKQVAVLAPTTILTLQHFKTFERRLKEFPCRVDYLNRFKTARQKKETLKALKNGEIDIIIGTHGLVSKQVEFKDLGLLIIDEEHKFGVGVKDKLKTLKVNVDTLTLTATPIPRTLQFSLMNARDMSIMKTPPVNRRPVQTKLMSFNEEQIREAILHEVSRGGQVYFIHNRVKNINEIAAMIGRLCPGVSICIGHGQMKPEQLEKIMLDFMDGQYDVLIATTIVESGLDIPNANTIIINTANMFGLSDLHQMRGRVGRSNRQAYCYLISPPLSTISSDARKRLKVIEQFSDIGSGFNIAMRDLDIRGAGDLLGAEQSGYISDIGLDTYQKILNETIEELKENEFKALFEKELQQKESFVDDCALETDQELLFTTDYINNVNERLALYKELSEVKNQEQLTAFKLQVTDRFGIMPEQAENLLKSVELKWLGIRLNFEKITLKKNTLYGSFISNPSSTFYSSGRFARFMYAIQQQKNVQLLQKNERLRIKVEHVKTVDQALLVLRVFIDVAS